MLVCLCIWTYWLFCSECLLFGQREYFKQGKIEQFRQILEEGSSPGIYPSFYVMDLLKNMILCINSLTSISHVFT